MAAIKEALALAEQTSVPSTGKKLETASVDETT